MSSKFNSPIIDDQDDYTKNNFNLKNISDDTFKTVKQILDANDIILTQTDLSNFNAPNTDKNFKARYFIIL